jgi:GntR family transcriptional regulator
MPGDDFRAAELPRPSLRYRQVADYLRQRLESHAGSGHRLPTDAVLSETFQVSRQTVRRAYAELVAEGLVQRTPGRGSFPRHPGRILMSVGSVDDLLAFGQDRDIRVLVPLTRVKNSQAATQLGLLGDYVDSVECFLFHEDSPIALSRIYLPPPNGGLLADVPFLQSKGGSGQETVLSILDRRLPSPIVQAKQQIAAIPAPSDVAALLHCEPVRAILRIEYLYFDISERPALWTVNFCNPDRYEYRAQLSFTRTRSGVAS